MAGRKIALKLHLWLGLVSGLLVFIIAVTGCIYAFQAEIQDLTQPYRFVEARQEPVLPPSQLQAMAEKVVPDKLVHAVLYAEPGKAAEVIFYNYEPRYHYIAYMNPYTGEVQQVVDVQTSFFGFILRGHFYLWLPEEVGQPVVASATLVFVVMLLTGIILWWPRNKKGTRQRFSIKWNARWRRRNFDLHNVLGFYVSALALLLALTGLVWGFKWFANGVYGLASGGKEFLEYQDPPSDTTQAATIATAPILDRVWHKIQAEHPGAAVVEVHPPMFNTSSIAATINYHPDTYHKIDYRYFDQYTMQELPVDHIWGRYQEATAADKLMRMNYDIHTGAILGLPGKVLAFLASLLCASLPVTGFFVWWGRRNKQNKKQKQPGQKRQQTAFS